MLVFLFIMGYNIYIMRKILLILIISLITITNAQAIQETQNPKQIVSDLDEVVLDNVNINGDNPEIVAEPENKTPELAQEKTLREKLQDIYHLEIEQIDRPSFLMSEILTHKCKEESAWEKFHLWAGYNGDIGFKFTEDNSFTNQYDFNAINVSIDGTLKNNNGDFRLMFNSLPYSSRNVMQNLFADAYIATNKIPHHRILIGNSRPPVGYEGAGTPFTLPYMTRAQIARNFGTVRKLGARISGNYSLADYDFGVYSSDTYFQEFFPGAEFIGWINLKPLGKTDGKYGKLLLGGGLQAGHRNNNYCVTGFNIRYDYKKFYANFEWAHANGYNGPQEYSTTKHASGFYTTVGYRITPKFQALLRYDQFDPNEQVAHNTVREYSAGINYFIKGQALKLMLNYVFCQNEAARDSHRILLGTQILL